MGRVPLLVDDHLLLRILLDDEPPDLRPRGAALNTTGLWYQRLCRAVSNPAVTGAMSSALAGIDAALAVRTTAAIIELPDAIPLLSLRTLSWPMAELLRLGASLNLLSLEALAAAQHLDAEICLAPSDDNQPLKDTAARFEVPLRIVAG